VLIRALLLGATASAALTTPALADDTAIMKRLDAMQHCAVRFRFDEV
jgi:hypothetical protein